MPESRITIMGLGLMGSGMARNLLDAGYSLTVYNRSEEKARIFADQGARVANSPREAAAGADIVISIVADDNASRAMWLGENGALAGMTSGAVAIESSTISLDWALRLAELAEQYGIGLLDAPVTGSKPQADSGDLVFLVGGPDAALARATPILRVMSRRIVHLGANGNGALVKLVNNFLCGVQAVSLAEALALIEASGLDRDAALGVLVDGAPGSPLIKTLSERMVARDYSPRFALRLLLKDISYAEIAGQRLGVPLATATAAHDVLEHAAAAGKGALDMSAIIEQFRQGPDVASG